MEGGMPSMVRNVGVSDGQVMEGDGSDVRSELNERQLSEKLEKSEAGRKKLRQAIALLKEKLDATSNALEVNEALRQEVEKERLNVDTERKRAEAEKALREKLEKENFSITEQFIAVLQRLDSLEGSYNADRSEFARIRSEVREAVGGIGAALQAVEATKGLYQSLERSLHAKINGAVQSSSKALAIAQSGQATTSRAQATALAAQSLTKAVQKEVQLVSSQILTLKKQASNLSILEAPLQQESQLKGPSTPLNSPDAGESNVSLAIPKEKVSIDAASPRPKKSSQAKDDSDEGDMLNMLVASTDKSRINPMCSSNGLPPRGGMFLSRNQLPDGGMKFSSLKKGAVAIITGVDSILSPAVRVSAPPLETATNPKSSPSLYITSPSARANGLQKQTEVQPQKLVDASIGPGNTELSNKRPIVKRGSHGKQVTSTPERPNVACNTLVVEDDHIFSEGMPMAQSNGKPYPSTTTKLLKSIMKMFEKEGRNRKSMEDKLMKLQGALEGQVVTQIGTKRKRETSKEKGDGGASENKERKRHHTHRKESKKKEGVEDAVTSPSGPPCNTTEDKCLLQEKEAPGDRLSEMISMLQDKCRGEGMFEATTVECQVNRDVSQECKEASSDVDICNEDVSKDGTGTNTDLESTDDDLGEDWWSRKVLLSPISSTDLTS